MDHFKKLLIIAGLFAIVLVGVVVAKLQLNEIAREVVDTPAAIDLGQEPRKPGTANDGLVVEPLPPADKP